MGVGVQLLLILPVLVHLLVDEVVFMVVRGMVNAFHRFSKLRSSLLFKFTLITIIEPFPVLENITDVQDLGIISLLFGMFMFNGISFSIGISLGLDSLFSQVATSQSER